MILPENRSKVKTCESSAAIRETPLPSGQELPPFTRSFLQRPMDGAGEAVRLVGVDSRTFCDADRNGNKREERWDLKQIPGIGSAMG